MYLDMCCVSGHVLYAMLCASAFSSVKHMTKNVNVQTHAFESCDVVLTKVAPFDCLDS